MPDFQVKPFHQKSDSAAMYADGNRLEIVVAKRRSATAQASISSKMNPMRNSWQQVPSELATRH